jgi:hypothetical protein
MNSQFPFWEYFLPTVFSVQYLCSVRGQQLYKQKRQRQQRPKKERLLKVETNEKVEGKVENVRHFLLGIPRRGDRGCN